MLSDFYKRGGINPSRNYLKSYCKVCDNKRHYENRKKNGYKRPTGDERLRMQRRRQRWTQNGMCSTCGSRPPRPGLKTCGECKPYQPGEVTREQYNKWGRTRTISRKKALIEKMGGKCADCGGVFPPYVYDFHHLEPKDKKFTLAKMIRNMSFEKLEQEASKCVLLCANCHRIREWGEQE